MSTLIGAKTGINTIAAVNSQCRLSGQKRTNRRGPKSIVVRFTPRERTFVVGSCRSAFGYAFMSSHLASSCHQPAECFVGAHVACPSIGPFEAGLGRRRTWLIKPAGSPMAWHDLNCQVHAAPIVTKRLSSIWRFSCHNSSLKGHRRLRGRDSHPAISKSQKIR